MDTRSTKANSRPPSRPPSRPGSRSGNAPNQAAGDAADSVFDRMLCGQAAQEPRETGDTDRREDPVNTNEQAQRTVQNEPFGEKQLSTISKTCQDLDSQASAALLTQIAGSINRATAPLRTSLSELKDRIEAIAPLEDDSPGFPGPPVVRQWPAGHCKPTV